MDFARLQLLQAMQAKPGLVTTVANDFEDLERWLPGTDLLVTYVAGPYPSGRNNDALTYWLQNGGRWFALHGTSGGKAIKTEHNGRPVRKMVKSEHHQTLGCFFLNHPPLCEFQVSVTASHPVTQDLPANFTVQDELYLIELQDADNCRILMTTELVEDPSPAGFGFHFDNDTALQPDGKTRVLGYARDVGRGEIVYVGLGHCHVGRGGSVSPVHPSVREDGVMPAEFRGPWETGPFECLLRNAIDWGIASR
jgi:hypothetical protein